MCGREIAEKIEYSETTVVSSTSSAVSGGSASGTQELRTHDATDSVRLTVTDAAGTSIAETRSF